LTINLEIHVILCLGIICTNNEYMADVLCGMWLKGGCSRVLYV
jgi:hypothetical protein